jgi:hypothetical protein
VVHDSIIDGNQEAHFSRGCVGRAGQKLTRGVEGKRVTGIFMVSLKTLWTLSK